MNAKNENMSNGDYIYEVKNVSKKYGNLVALENMNLLHLILAMIPINRRS